MREEGNSLGFQVTAIWCQAQIEKLRMAGQRCGTCEETVGWTVDCFMLELPAELPAEQRTESRMEPRIEPGRC